MAKNFSTVFALIFILIKAEKRSFHPKGENHHQKGNNGINVTINPELGRLQHCRMQRGKEEGEKPPQYAAESVNGRLSGQLF